jgi:hypothetical protein
MAATSGTYAKVFTGQISTCGIRTDGVIECAVDEDSPLAGSFVDFALYLTHGCGVRTDGTIACFGDNDLGQAPSTRTAATGSFTQVAVGYAPFTCALRTDGRIECWGDRAFGAFMHVPPTATFTAPPSVIVGQPIALALADAQVPGYPSATSFLYAFDCGAGFNFASSVATASCPTTSAGIRSVGGKVIDQDDDFTTYTATVTVKSAEQGTTDLGTDISLATLSPDLRKALLAKLNSALDAIEKGKTKAACSALADFINQVSAQRGKAIPTATADDWILTAEQLRFAIGC